MVLFAAMMTVEPAAAVPAVLVAEPTRKVPEPRLAKKIPNPLRSKVPALLNVEVLPLPTRKLRLVGAPTSPTLKVPAPEIFSLVVELTPEL